MKINCNTKQVLVDLLFVIGSFICRIINRRQRDREPEDYDY